MVTPAVLDQTLVDIAQIGRLVLPVAAVVVAVAQAVQADTHGSILGTVKLGASLAL